MANKSDYLHWQTKIDNYREMEKKNDMKEREEEREREREKEREREGVT